MVVMKAAGRAVAMSVRACRAVRHESAAGVNGSPYIMLSHKVQCIKRKTFLHAGRFILSPECPWILVTELCLMHVCFSFLQFSYKAYEN
jgi:hypothetical protein